jgi:hypothetical protein
MVNHLSRNVLIAMVVLCSVAIGIFYSNRGQKELPQIGVTLAYNTHIDGMPIATLKNLRYLTSGEKKQLFADLRFADHFAIEKVIPSIKHSSKNNVILWFTNHFGQVSDKGLAWYKHHVLSTLSNATFWLVDLAAWRFLSIKEASLLPCKDFTDFVKKQRSGILLKPSQSPVINDSSKLMQDISQAQLKLFKTLHADNFFTWLFMLKGTVNDLEGDICNRLCKEGLRPGSAHFSLSDIGYKPPFLDVIVPKLNTNILEADHSQVFPLLQYLEGIYYVYKIIEHCKNSNQEIAVTFLLPNKEFTYYLVEGEEHPFDTFKRNVAWLLARVFPKETTLSVSLYFQPFAYGEDFSDQPYSEDGPFIKDSDSLVDTLVD